MRNTRKSVISVHLFMVMFMFLFVYFCKYWLGCFRLISFVHVLYGIDEHEEYSTSVGFKFLDQDPMGLQDTTFIFLCIFILML